MSDAISSTPSPVTISLPREAKPNLGRILSGTLLVVCVFDVCFWQSRPFPGLSMAVFFALLGVAILWNRQARQLGPAGRLILGLFGGSVLAAAIETGFTNTVVLLALTVVLSGETYFEGVASRGGRWMSQGVALLFAPGRVIWLGLATVETILTRNFGLVGMLVGGSIMVIPSVLLVLFFGWLLATGNVVFGTWTNDGFAWIWKQITLDLAPARIFLWLVVAMTSLALLRPTQVSPWWWSWTERLPRLPDILPHRLALLNSALILIMLNLLFAVANTADAIFIWSGRSLPAGATYSGSVHSGVTALTITAVLSAVVLTSIFQQTLAVAQRRELKILGGVWIAQNLFLLMSVGLRLRYYVEAYDATVQRFGVLIFLVLIVAGYGLLAVKIVRDKSLSWLLGGGVLAVFAVLYVTQFLNLAGWAADYNVAQWEKDRARRLDVGYLHELGPAAWPALARAENLGATKEWDGLNARYGADRTPSEVEARDPRTRLDLGHWREFSLRAWLNRGALQQRVDNK